MGTTQHDVDTAHAAFRAAAETLQHEFDALQRVLDSHAALVRSLDYPDYTAAERAEFIDEIYRDHQARIALAVIERDKRLREFHETFARLRDDSSGK